MDGKENVQDSVIEEEVTEQPEQTDNTQVEDVSSESVNTSVAEETVDDTVEIGGEKYTLDEIREFKQGYLRQSDYTKKTQELANQRREVEDAVKLYEYLRDNPHLLNNLQNDYVDEDIRSTAMNLTPEMQRLQELEMKFVESELDREISELKEKYSDFDEVKILKEADKRGLTDLEFVYKALREDDKMDVEKIKQDAVAEAKKQIMAELQQNKEVTKTLIANESVKQEPTPITLTPAQKRVANGMGISEEEYAKWLNKR